MDPVTLARLQFTITTVYHFLFVPLTLGLSVFIALIETMYARTGDEVYRRMARFWGKLFLLNFAVGVVTGLIQEFQFGMNWAQYSTFMGDIFGAPLAIEALLAFYLESIFMGLWIFGWDRLSPKAHAAVAWIVAIGSNLSAFWILVASSFMHQPVGYQIVDGRVQMNDFWALITNPHLATQFPHVVTGAWLTAAFFILGISAWHLRKKQQDEVFRRSFRIAAPIALISAMLVTLLGHIQGQHMIQCQPMKMAAAEALWEDADPAGLSLFTWGDEEQLKDVWAIHMPYVLSFMAHDRFDGKVKGIKNLKEDYEARFGPGDYVPSVFTAYWSFRAMVGAGILMLILSIWAVAWGRTRRALRWSLLMRALPWAIGLPFLANTTGWILTEVGRQPWVVFELLKTEDAISPYVTSGQILFSIISFTLIFMLVSAAEVFLMLRFIKKGPEGEHQPAEGAS
ncbi:cytochrome ubiquinol oxidase subunit I [Myxococcota bacterium]|nr:cytochrome ubiquinol oxidase subunit I [Myxococcota bacterium]